MIGSATQRWRFRAIAGAAGLLRGSTGIGLPAARQMAGGILEADLFVTDTNVHAASGIFSATLGDSPTDPKSAHTGGPLDPNGVFCLNLPVNGSTGTTTLYCEFKDKVYEISEIIIEP